MAHSPRKEHKIMVRVTPDQYETILRSANRHTEANMSAFVRRAALAEASKDSGPTLYNNEARA
jgi:uncharacterized protein (DUF1778 family)